MQNTSPRSPRSTQGRELPLLDGAASERESLAAEWENQRALAVDPGRDVEERLEAYDNIIDSEIGDTSMSRARNIEREVGLRQLYLKFEGGNPTGTQKDRIAFAQAMDALRRGFDTITAATCGNYGVAVALAARLAGLRCVVHVPAAYHTRRGKEMEELDAEIIRVDGDYERAVVVSRDTACAREFYDANPGGLNTALQLLAYGVIAYEIYDELRDAPAVVSVPVSNGTTLAGIYRGFLSLHRRGKTSRVPRLVAGSSYRKNPIVCSYLTGGNACADLDPRRIHGTDTNEPLVNWHAIDGDHALQALHATTGWASNASDKAMRHYSKTIREREGLSVLPASTAGLIALLERHRREPLPNDRYVAVLTGRR